MIEVWRKGRWPKMETMFLVPVENRDVYYRIREDQVGLFAGYSFYWLLANGWERERVND